MNESIKEDWFVYQKPTEAEWIVKKYMHLKNKSRETALEYQEDYPGIIECSMIYGDYLTYFTHSLECTNEKDKKSLQVKAKKMNSDFKECVKKSSINWKF